jgi:hypothetical protein
MSFSTRLKPNLELASLLAVAVISSMSGIEIGGPDDPFESRQKPINTGRRAEKDSIAKAKAEAKRQRKALKRI